MNLSTAAGMGWETFQAHLWGKKIPLNVMLSVTNRCLSRCNYCNIPQRHQKEMSLAEITGLIDQMSGMGCRRLGLWGGEPLIRDDIGEIIDYAKKKSLFVTMDSNGYLLPRKIESVKRLDHIILALDGPQDAHERNREAGSFQKVMAALDAASGRIPLWTITVLTRHNLEAVDFILEQAQEFGFLATFQVLHHNDCLGRNTDNLLAPASEYRRVIQKIINAKKRGARVGSSFKYLERVLRWEDYSSPIAPYRNGSGVCWAGRLYCNVDTDGSVYPCSLLIGKVPALNALDAGFKKAFRDINPVSCGTCTASCFTEYNYLYSLDIGTIAEWLNAFRKTGKRTLK